MVQYLLLQNCSPTSLYSHSVGLVGSNPTAIHFQKGITGRLQALGYPSCKLLFADALFSPPIHCSTLAVNGLHAARPGRSFACRLHACRTQHDDGLWSIIASPCRALTERLLLIRFSAPWSILYYFITFNLRSFHLPAILERLEQQVARSLFVSNQPSLSSSLHQKYVYPTGFTIKLVRFKSDYK